MPIYISEWSAYVYVYSLKWATYIFAYLVCGPGYAN